MFSLLSIDVFQSQCGGRLLAQRNVYIYEFSVGTSLSGCSTTEPTVAAGGSLFLNSSSVSGGMATYGVSIQVSNSGVPCGSVQQPPTSNFTLYRDRLLNSSKTLGLYPPNGMAILENQRLTLSGADPNTNVFFISQITANKTTEISIDVPGGSYAYINVGGLTPSLKQLQMSYAPHVSLSKILFNFPQAISVQLVSGKAESLKDTVSFVSF